MSRHVIPVRIDAKIFSRFSFFDAFRLRKRWKSPALFGGMMLAFSLVSFSRIGRAEGAVLLGTVLLTVGLGLPGSYFISFFLSVRRQIKKMGLEVPRPVYTLTLSDGADEIHVAAQNGREARYEWAGIYGLYQGKGCSYLYVTPGQAYLLPDGDVGESGEALWRTAESYGKARRGRGK